LSFPHLAGSRGGGDFINLPVGGNSKKTVDESFPSTFVRCPRGLSQSNLATMSELAQTIPGWSISWLNGRKTFNKTYSIIARCERSSPKRALKAVLQSPLDLIHVREADLQFDQDHPKRNGLGSTRLPTHRDRFFERMFGL